MSRDRAEDLFDVFEPWTERGVEVSVAFDPPSMRTPRKRIGPRIPPPVRPRPPEPEPSLDPAAFLREVGIPEIHRIERRMRAVDHQLRQQDLLDLPDPALRVLFWPHPGPMHTNGTALRGTLEFMVQWGEADALLNGKAEAARRAGATIEARFWIAGEPGRPVLRTAPVAELKLPWLRGCVLDFIELMLARV